MSNSLSLFFFILILISTSIPKASLKAEKLNSLLSEDLSVQKTKLEGYYVTDGYFKKEEGYDWVAVIVEEISENELKIAVRSRADRKRPTCTLDTKVYLKEDKTFATKIRGRTILFQFTDDKLTIKPADTEAAEFLYFYCSGGATVAGEYSRINGEIDREQIDPTIFHEDLLMQNIGFEITTIQDKGRRRLRIVPYGLARPNQTFTSIIKDKVKKVEIEDLNSDGFPELMIITESQENKGNVIGFSVVNGQVLQRIYFPDISENPELENEYNGFDEFALVENSLSRKFPAFNKKKRTGEYKQVVYKMVEKEDTLQFVITEVEEYKTGIED